ncbi:MAG TPA: YIP1 family protein [Thermoanaerobaculia bacterium]|nr:YIP1 family protein [Thermoanaerobaculia bacterium]
MKDSSWGRLVGVLVAPGETFRSIAERPTWLPPLLGLLLLGLAVGVIVQMKTDPEEMVRGQMEMMKVDVPPEQIDKMVEDAEGRSTTATMALTVLGVFVQAAMYAVIAVLFWLGLRLFGSEMDYLSSLATTLHAYMPLAVASLINLPLMMARESLSFEEVVSGGVLVSSLKALAPEDAPPVLESLLGNFDLFTVWTVVLLIIGYKIVGKVSTAVAAGIVILYWLIYVGGKLAFTAAFLR